MPKKANSFIQDTDFLNKLKNVSDLPNNTMLVTLNVCSLYTNISHSNGLSALNNKLPNNQTTSIILQLTKFILEHNHFKFQDKHYLQIKGTAMGTPMAPQYANIFMAHLEERILEKSTQKPILYLRCIDDIFMLWTHGEKALSIFCSQFNLTDPNIQLTINFALDEINFLDTIIKIKDNKLITTLYQKPTRKFNYIHPKSSHPPHIFKSIIFSQALRYNHICSDNNNCNSNYIQFKYNFQKLGYDTESINKQFNRTQSIPRDLLLQYKPKSQKKRTPLVLTYHPQIRFVAHIAKRLQPILKSDPLLQHLFPVPQSLTDNHPTSNGYSPPIKTLNLTRALFLARLPDANFAHISGLITLLQDPTITNSPFGKDLRALCPMSSTYSLVYSVPKLYIYWRNWKYHQKTNKRTQK